MSDNQLEELKRLQSAYKNALDTAFQNAFGSPRFRNRDKDNQTPEQYKVSEAAYATQEMRDILNWFLTAPDEESANSMLKLLQDPEGIQRWRDGFRTHKSNSNPDIVNVIECAEALVDCIEKLTPPPIVRIESFFEAFKNAVKAVNKGAVNVVNQYQRLDTVNGPVLFLSVDYEEGYLKLFFNSESQNENELPIIELQEMRLDPAQRGNASTTYSWVQPALKLLTDLANEHQVRVLTQINKGDSAFPSPITQAIIESLFEKQQQVPFIGPNGAGEVFVYTPQRPS